MENINSLIRQRYEIDLELFDLRMKLSQLEEDIPQFLYDLRCSKAAYEEYISNAFPAVFYKLTGKYEEKKEELLHVYKRAQETYASGKLQMDSCRSHIESLESESKALPSREEFASMLPNSEYLKNWDTYYCITCTLSLLERNREFLICARDWAENRNADFKPNGTHYEKSLALNEAAECATQICAFLEQIVGNGFSLEIHPYFQNPGGFIAAVARQYGQQDRINYAVSAVKSTNGILQNLQHSLDVQ